MKSGSFGSVVLGGNSSIDNDSIIRSGSTCWFELGIGTCGLFVSFLGMFLSFVSFFK